MKIILASGSPRRKELLGKLINKFDIIISNFDEDIIKSQENNPEELVKKLSLAKANDIFSAYERAVYCQALGEEKGIDFFISLHINAVDNPDVSRYDIYYSEENPSAEKLRTFCSGLEANLDNKLLIHETTRGKAMYVTKYSKFPSVLLEMGFATNLHDATNLNSDTWRHSFARTVTEQIVEYFNN